MQFTPQQLAGAGKYNCKVRIGNWSEDQELEETKLKAYLLKKERGELATGSVGVRMKKANQSVPHSYAADGKIRFGDTVVLAHPATGAVAANDLWDVTEWGKQSFATSCVPGAGAATARTTFVVTPYYPKKGAKGDAAAAARLNPPALGDVLNYGQDFCLATNPSLRVDDRTGFLRKPLFLHSQMAGAGSYAKASHNQECTMRPGGDIGTVWKCLPQDRTKRLGMGAAAVCADEVFVMRHKATGNALSCSADYKLANDFGNEFELSCMTKTKTSKTHTLNTEFAGVTTGDDDSRSEMGENIFSFRLSDSPDAAVDNRVFQEMTPEVIIQKIRDIVNKRGNYAIRGLGRSFRIMDDAGDGALSRPDFKWGLHDYGVHLSDEEFDFIMDFFDKNDDGTISFDEFLVTIRGAMNDRRKEFVAMAYQLLDKNGDQRVTISDIAAAYDVSENPEVISGEKTPEEALREFMEQWDTQEKDGIVTYSEFLEYYRDVSASVDDDDYFELMMRNAWHISGGEGWCENTSCRRVLVIWPDDSQEVVEIENDLGLKADDIAGMIERVEAQTGKRVKKISLAD